jgi:hypothetical protein
MPISLSYSRLEPRRQERDWEAGFSAPIHDPVWFLARQWQMGEHQGENASSPMVATYVLRLAPIALPAASQDPAIIPAEAMVESELDDWWTMGRRIRIGSALSRNPAVQGHTELQFTDPQPPYERFVGAFDGKAIWDARARLGLAEADFGADVAPAGRLQAWDDEQLVYQQTDENAFTAPQYRLGVRRHPGGRMDWHSVDAAPRAQPQGEEQETTQMVIPTALQYPGAPNSRWWEIEDAVVDLGGYPPDSAHVPTAMLTELIFSHGDDWFLFPVTARAGNIATLRDLEVTDSFGRSYKSADWKGLRPPENWTLFQTAGLPGESLVLWHVAELPLESGPIERVQFGLDEQSLLMWAVERVVASRDLTPTLPEDPGNPKLNVGKPPADASKMLEYVYVPGEGIAPYWHPYVMDEVGGQRKLVQRGLVDLSRQRPSPMPPPRAETLYTGTPEQPTLHQVAPLAIPSNGIEIERRWMLARDMVGNPVLWIERQRKPLRTPPARRLRFDVMQVASS